MTIETKYNIGDEVWLMYNNRAFNGVVESVVSVQNTTCYMIRSFSGKKRFMESLLFPTKEKLLESL